MILILAACGSYSETAFVETSEIVPGRRGLFSGEDGVFTVVGGDPQPALVTASPPATSPGDGNVRVLTERVILPDSRVVERTTRIEEQVVSGS